MAVAARVAAATQYGNRYAVWTGTEAEGRPAEDVAVPELTGGTEDAEQPIAVTDDAVLETLGTGLFSSRGQERLGWSHQTFAEYLAARYCLERSYTIEQLRSLVFHPRRARVIPQVREVASWLALQHGQLFREIAEADPEVLLGSAAPSLSIEQRRVLTEALFESSDRNQILHVHHNLVLRNLAHPRMGEQLEPVLRNRTRPEGTRYFAAKIVRDCGVTDIGETLLAITLSADESLELRTVVAYALGDVGSESERERMRPLLGLSREIDPKDELRGAALRAVYPGSVYDEAMWDFLEHPRASLFFGAYNSFLSYSVAPKLNAANLPAALRWCTEQSVEDIGPIVELEANIFELATGHLQAEEVAEALAGAVLKRCRAFRGLPSRRSTKQKSLEQMLLEDDERRRRFLSAFLPLLNPEDAHLMIFPLALLTSRDLDWFLERIEEGRSPDPSVEANLVRRLACSWEADAVMNVWNACERNLTINTACQELFDPWPLDSEMANWERRSRADFLKEQGIETAPAMGPRLEAALSQSETEDVDAWMRVLYEMSVEEGSPGSFQPRWMKMPTLPGWIGASEETRNRIVESAKRYLTRTTFPESGPAEPNLARNGASAAIDALWLIQLAESSYLQEQTDAFWARWVPSFLGAC